MNIAIYILAGIGAAAIVVLIVSLFNHMFRGEPFQYAPMTEDIHTRPFSVEDYHRMPKVDLHQARVDFYSEDGDMWDDHMTGPEHRLPIKAHITPGFLKGELAAWKAASALRDTY